MNQDRDVSPGSEPTGPPTHQPEYTLWTMAQEPRRLEARVRLGGLGLELRLLVDDELIWSQAFGSSAALTRAAEQKRLDFKGRGWGEDALAAARDEDPLNAVHVAVAQRAGLSVSELLDLTHGKVSPSVAMRLGSVSVSDVTAFIGGSGTMRMAQRLGVSLPVAASSLAQAVGRDGAIGIILGLLLGNRGA